MNMTDELTGYINEGAHIVTVNTRLARHLTSRYDRAMEAAGASVWRSPVIIPFSAWIELLWNESWAERTLLPDAASKALWEKTVLEDSVTIPLGSGARVAQAAYDAYELTTQYRITLGAHDDLYLTDEARALKGWIKSYGERLRALGSIDRAGLTAELAARVSSGKVGLPQVLVLCGFDELTPSQSELFTGIGKKGVKVVTFDPPQIPVETASIKIRPFADETAEAVQAARWVRSVIRPGMTVGVIAPQLGAYRDIIKREFSAELDPASVLPGIGAQELFNISLGEPLYAEPLVKSALDILSIGEGFEDIFKISAMLHSPFISTGDEYLALSRIDAGLRRDNRLATSLAEIKDLARRYPALEDFERRVSDWIAELRSMRRKAAPSQWAERLSALLKKTGWPSTVKLTSSEYQAMSAWRGALEELSCLDDVTGPVSRTEAVLRLGAIARDTIHQPKTPECQVQVMGLLESAGLRFDRVWLLGCHDLAIPAGPSPNPFIPLSIQRAKGLPHSSFEKEARFAKTVLTRIVRSAPQTEVSYPLRSGEKDMRLTPFFAGLGAVDGAGINASARLSDAVRAASVLVDMPQDQPIHTTDEELAMITGGTEILKNQSLCPFKAFATHRLFANGVDKPELGLTHATDRGSIIHKALKMFWGELGGSDKLLELSKNGGMDGYVADITDRVFADVKVPPPLSAHFLEIEKQRLSALLKSWVDVEVKRSGVRRFTVKGVELEQELSIAGLSIKTRADRIDVLDDGTQAVVDYKSGKVDRDLWLTGRPRDPQLLVYSICGRFDAISFASLRPGECRFIGISSAADLLPGIKPFEKDGIREKLGVRDWPSLMELWKTTLERLAGDFVSGIADVDPIEINGKNSPCVHCDLHTLCRVCELGFVNAQEENGDTDE